MSIEREQPSTAFRSMPAYGALHSSFKAQPIDELTGTFDAQMGELRSDHLTFKAQPINELTGEGRPMNVWTNGSATSFEDRMTQDFDSNDVVFCNGIDPDIQRPTHPNDNIGSTAGPGGSTFMTETFEPAAGMNSFGESLNPVLEVGGNSGPGGSTSMTGRFDMPTNNLGGSAGPGGDDV